MKFRSKFEKSIYDHAREHGRELVYEPEEPPVRYNRPARYIPDFQLPNGIIVEAKGRFTSADRTKMLRVREQNRELDIRFVFQRASNRLTKSPNSKTYGQWCDYHGFTWASDKIPQEWFDE